MLIHLHKNITDPGAEISPLEYDLKAQHQDGLLIMEQLSLDFQQEVWKDVPGYEDSYQASTLGRIKSLRRLISVINHGTLCTRIVSEKILIQIINPTGYLSVAFSIGGKAKIFRVNRLVCLTFIPNYGNKPQVNHKNGIKADNRIENLEWCTAKENNDHAILTGLMPPAKGAFKGHRGAGHPNARPINKYSIDGVLIETFPSTYEAALSINSSRSAISAACLKNRITGGFKWKKKI